MSERSDDVARVADALKRAGFAVWLGDEFAAGACDAAGARIVTSNTPADALPFVMRDLPDAALPGHCWHSSGFLNIALFEPSRAEIEGADKFARNRLAPSRIS